MKSLLLAPDRWSDCMCFKMFTVPCPTTKWRPEQLAYTKMWNYIMLSTYLYAIMWRNYKTQLSVLQT